MKLKTLITLATSSFVSEKNITVPIDKSNVSPMQQHLDFMFAKIRAEPCEKCEEKDKELTRLRRELSARGLGHVL